MYLLLILVLCLGVLSACGTNSSNNNQEQEEKISWEDMERVEIYLPDFEDEWKKDKKEDNWQAFYEKYKDKVLVIKDAEVTYNHLDDSMNYLDIGYGADGRYGSARFFFDEEDRTDEIMNFSYGEKVIVEGILKQPEQTYAKPFYLEIEHTKLIEHSAWENPFFLPIDMEPVYAETEAELIKNYSFIKKVEFKTRKSPSGRNEDIEFITDIEPGTDAKEVLDYADYAARLLNENARKVDDTIAPSTGDSYGGLYKYNYLCIMARPEGVVEAQNKYYILDTISARIGDTINLQKAYRQK